MAENDSPVALAFAQFLLPANGQELDLPLRGAVENTATNNGANTSTGNSATDSFTIANPDTAFPGSTLGPRSSPANPKSEAFDAEARRKEAELRFQAIRYMAKVMEDNPNARIFSPPPWYRRDEDPSSIAHNRPLKWIKDRKTGKLRPVTMMDRLTPLRRPEIKAKKRKATMEPETDTTTIDRVYFYPEKPLVPTPRGCITSLLTLNPNRIVSVETNIDSGYYADVESGSD